MTRAVLNSLFCAWVLFSMQQEPDSSYLYKLASEPMTADACRQEVRMKAARGTIAPVGLLGWYRVPSVGYWIGCFPQEWDPYERR